MLRRPGSRSATRRWSYLLLYPWPGNLRQLAPPKPLADPETTFTPALLSPEIRRAAHRASQMGRRRALHRRTDVDATLGQ